MADVTIDTLDPTLVAQAESFLVSFLQESYPSLDLTEGRVLRNLLIRPAALFHALNQTNMDNLRKSMSLLEIEKDPALASINSVDAVLSNFRVTRNQGTRAQGQVTIVISNLLATTIEASTVFEALGLRYAPLTTYVGVTTQEAVTSDQSRLIVARSDGTFAFTVQVEAADVGEQYQLKRGTRFALDPVPPGFIDAFATDDFSDGTNTETNEELINRFKLGISQPVFSGRIQIENLLRTNVPGMQQVSIIGFGDAEMIRDRHNIFSTSHGGKADLYCRTTAVPVETRLIKEATLIDAEAQLWQLSIDRDDAPGFYTIESILPENDADDQGSLEIASEVRGLDLSAAFGEFVPDVQNLVEGGFSRYQTAVLRFVDPNTPASSSSSSSSSSAAPTKRKYKVRVLALPSIKQLQELSVDRNNRNPQADYLVRAPIPVFCTVSMRVLYRSGVEAPDPAKIQLEVAARVNALGFAMGQLPASVIYDAAHNVMAKNGTTVVTPIDIRGLLLKPGGGSVQLASTARLVVPNLPEETISQRTAVFYLNPNDIDIVVEKVETLPV